MSPCTKGRPLHGAGPSNALRLLIQAVRLGPARLSDLVARQRGDRGCVGARRLDDERHAAVELCTGGVTRGVRTNETRLAVTDRAEERSIDALRHEVVAHCVGTLTRELQVVGSAASGIGET